MRLEAVRQANNKARISLGNTKQLIIRSKLSSWEAKLKFYKAVALPTLLYGAEIIGINFVDMLETTQMYFFKNLFCWNKNTPNYIVRRETHHHKMELEIFTRATKWWMKILIMNDYRFPKMCYTRLKHLTNSPNNIAKYNCNTILGNVAQNRLFLALGNTKSFTGERKFTKCHRCISNIS